MWFVVVFVFLLNLLVIIIQLKSTGGGTISCSLVDDVGAVGTRLGSAESVKWSNFTTQYSTYNIKTDLHAKVNRFRANLELGLCLSVSGETPTSLLFAFVLFRLFTWPKQDAEQVANSLNDSRSSTAFSRFTILFLHMSHM